MVRHLKAAEDQGRLMSKLTSYLRPSVLVVDEECCHPLERTEANLVFQVVSKRYEKGSIILTSNKTFGKAHMFRRTCARRRRNSTGSLSLTRRHQLSSGPSPRAVVSSH
ncbi:IstB domain protein ATP-binding protein [Streptomyces sp. ACT-1]|nr:IstB domain protein ATP-binding protein [Streptomyces sp. ACT-1]